VATQPSVWASALLASQAALAAVWVPAFAFDPLGTAVHQDVVSIVLIMAVFVGPTAWGSGLVAGRTRDERRRFRWLMGFGILAAVTSWVIVSYAADLLSCGPEAVLAPSGEVSCSSSMLERITGMAMAEAAILGQWFVARRESGRAPRDETGGTARP
jgi:hypothetical protein